MQKNKSAFTFVELIVVLVIIAILSTIGFISYESFLSTGRDTAKISLMKDMHTSFGTYGLQSRIPLPDNKVDITASGSVFAYQGDFTQEIANTIGFKGNPYDDTLDIYPSYIILSNRKDTQILHYLEDPQSIQTASIHDTYAFTDYQQLFPKVTGKALGILIERDSQEPLHLLDIASASGSYDIINGTGALRAYYSQDEYYEDNMSRIIPDKSCLRILELGGARGDGVYRISPFGAEKINVYCDMSTQGGGWTLVLNYLHQGGTNPSLNILTNSLPLQNSTILGSDESGSVYWGHTSNQLLDSFDFEELKFYGITSNHDRVMHFSTTSCIDYFRTGTGNCSGISENFTPQKGHTSVFPTSGSSFFSNQGDLAMTNFPFFISGNYHWGIRGINNRWEVDDYSNNSSMDTHHQIYIR